MSELLFYVILIPTVVMAVKFWVKAVRWGIRNQRTLGLRVQRLRSAVVEASREEE
jgi:hypothetical protein